MNKAILSMAVGVLAIVAAGAALAQPEIKSATYTITEVKQYNLQVVRISGQSLTVDVEGFGRRRFQMPRGFTFDIDGEAKTLNQILPGQKLHAYVTETQTGELLMVQKEGDTVGVVGETVTDDDDAPAGEAASELVIPGAAPQEAAPEEATPEEAAPEEAAPDETAADDALSGGSFESPPAELPATADNRGWMAILGGALLPAGLAVGWYRRRQNDRNSGGAS